MNTVKPIIEIKGIGKEYDIAHQKGGYVTLRDILTNVAKRPFAFLKHKAKQVAGFEAKEAFWALRDVSFDVMPGEIIGIIGANGAGKSTLLKILTGITPPTEGEIIMRGRVASLLEVGTGFHPELTGRENIFLNGAILGMTKKEIVQKFDAIVEFSGIDKFLDTPVKRYSSGMYVRLAFSVAAHMEPDILLVDEVLAVGDAEFQKKCLGKMEEVTHKDGRTILFVSHNLSAIKQLCKKTVLIEKGEVVMFDETEKVIEYYLHKDTNISGNFEHKDDFNKKAQFTSLTIKNATGEISQSLSYDEDWSVDILYTVRHHCPKAILNLELSSTDGVMFLFVADADNEDNIPDKEPGEYKATVSIPKLLLNPGDYYLRYVLQSPGVEAYDISNSARIQILSNSKNVRDKYFKGKQMGYIGPISNWKTVKMN